MNADRRNRAILQNKIVGSIPTNIMSQTHIYQFLRERLLSEDPSIDERTLLDTLEGLTDLHEILGELIRSALSDEATAIGLRGRIMEMTERLDRLRERACTRRAIAREVMTRVGIRRVTAYPLARIGGRSLRCTSPR